jgi:ribonuclease HII
MNKKNATAPTFEIENVLRAAGATVVAGVDEVGKGSWAGPLVVCVAVVDHARFGSADLLARDSKTLSEKKREAIFGTVAAQCSAWSLGVVEAHECDSLGMSAAQRLATKRAFEVLGMAVDAAVVDGKWDFVSPLVPRVEMRVKADSVSASVAAASVLAKVSRDRLMRDHAANHPNWNFAGNKGYPCPKHRDGLREHGVSALHRTSWAFMDNMNLRGGAGAPSLLEIAEG